MKRDTNRPLRFPIGHHPRSLDALRRGACALAGLVLLVGLVLVAAGTRAWAGAALAIGAALAGVFAWLSLERLRAKRSRELLADTAGLWLCIRGGTRTPIVLFGRPFGIALFSNRSRDRFVAAFTTYERSGYVGTRVAPDRDTPLSGLIPRTSTLFDDETPLDAVGPDGEPITISAADLSKLLSAVSSPNGQPFERCVLSDSSGSPVILDGKELRVGRKIFDLGSPIEWRPLVFQESVGALSGGNDWEPNSPPVGSIMVYQGTWLRQGVHETVLISLVDSIAGHQVRLEEIAAVARADYGLLRDLRLAQAAPEPPPPRELRVAIERPYMLRLRTALDQAPRASQKAERAAGSAVRSS